MANDKQHATHCRGCGRERDDGERFSARGKCSDCGDGRMIDNRRQLAAHGGPFFDHWRRRCLASFGVIAPLDDDAPTR